MRFIFSIFLLALACAACNRQTQLVISPPKTDPKVAYSITTKGDTAGKWLFIISSTLSDDPLRAHRYYTLGPVLRDIFEGERGGSYANTIELNDLPGKGPMPTRAKVLESFESIEKSVSSFKENNPNAPTMLVLGITAHGLIHKGNHHYFRLKDYAMTGKEFVEIINGLNVDETLIFLQSCHGGALAQRDFPDYYMNRSAGEIAAEAAKKRMKLAVITPVSGSILALSPLTEMSLEKSLTDSVNDTDENGIITYKEFKNAYMHEACQSNFFVPFSDEKTVLANTGGISPHFYESNISGNLPLTLTRRGARLWRKNRLDLTSSQISSDTSFTPETINYCHEQGEIFENETLLDWLDRSPPAYKSNNIYSALDIIEAWGLAADSHKHYDAVLDIASNSELKSFIRVSALQALYNTVKYPETTKLITEILSQKKESDLLRTAIILSEQLIDANDTIKNLILDLMENTTNEETLITCLSIIHKIIKTDKRARDRTLELFTKHEKDGDIFAAGNKEEFPLAVLALAPLVSEDSELRTKIITLLGKRIFMLRERIDLLSDGEDFFGLTAPHLRLFYADRKERAKIILSLTEKQTQ